MWSQTVGHDWTTSRLHFSVDMCVLSCFSHIQLFETLWAVASQAPLSTGFSRKEYWSGLPFLPPGDIPNPGIKPTFPALQENSLPRSTGEALCRHSFLEKIKLSRANRDRFPHLWPTTSASFSLPPSSSCHFYSKSGGLFSLLVIIIPWKKWKSISHVWLFATPWTVICQVPLSMEFSRQNTGMGCHFLLQRVFLTQGLNPVLLLCRQILPSEPPQKTTITPKIFLISFLLFLLKGYYFHKIVKSLFFFMS